MDEKTSNKFECLTCNKFLSSKHSLKRHQIDVHKNKNLTMKKHIFRIICPECDSVCSRYYQLREHFISEHKFNLEEISLEFNEIKGRYFALGKRSTANNNLVI